MLLPKKIGSSCAEENKMKIMYILLLLPLLYQCQSKKNIFMHIQSGYGHRSVAKYTTVGSSYNDVWIII